MVRLDIVSNEKKREQRKAELARLITVKKKAIKAAPEGCLRITTNRGNYQYYHFINSKERQRYLSKKDFKLARKLAQKAYDKKVVSAAERELNGSGYEATRGRLNALAIYKAAGLYEWMGRFEGQYPEFSEMILHVIQGFQVGLLLGRTYSDWNENFEAEFLKEVEDYEEAREPFVWYAAYGSNISRERFMRYIEHCADKSEPAEDRSFEFFHDILFADKAKNWGNQGKAYLDDRKEGRALGRIYKIRRSQFAEIQRMEGPDYTKKLHLGWEDGISVYTFTNAGIPDELNSPSAAYVDVILKGLMETYPERSELALRVYLYSRNVLSKDDRDILSYIRGSAHGVSLQDIAEDPECPCLTKARKSVKQLIELGLIRQDGRSVRASAPVVPLGVTACSAG